MSQNKKKHEKSNTELYIEGLYDSNIDLVLGKMILKLILLFNENLIGIIELFWLTFCWYDGNIVLKYLKLFFIDSQI